MKFAGEQRRACPSKLARNAWKTESLQAALAHVRTLHVWSRLAVRTQLPFWFHWVCGWGKWQKGNIPTVSRLGAGHTQE